VNNLAILIPTYGRTDRLQAVVDDALAGTPGANVYLIMEPHEAVSVDGAITITRDEGYGTYAHAINDGYEITDELLVFAAADDLHFELGWYEHARDMLHGGIQVAGTNDLHNPEVLAGEHATHYLVQRAYLDMVGGDALAGPGTFLTTAYTHNWVDKEFVQTAQLRGVFAPCLDAIVEHRHVAWGLAGMDATYDKSFAQEPLDRAVYDQRMSQVMRRW
jgi:hypothetical protein